MSSTTTQSPTDIYNVKLSNSVSQSLNVIGGTGYDWYIKTINGEAYEKTQTVSNLTLVITTNLHVTQSRPGNKTTRVFTMKPSIEGIITIVFEYRRIWEPQSVKEHIVVLNVTK